MPKHFVVPVMALIAVWTFAPVARAEGCALSSS
jgi:hypothetical protein